MALPFHMESYEASNEDWYESRFISAHQEIDKGYERNTPVEQHSMPNLSCELGIIIRPLPRDREDRKNEQAVPNYESRDRDHVEESGHGALTSANAGSDMVDGEPIGFFERDR